MELALALPGKETGDKISLSDETFGREYNEPLVHQSVVTYLAGALLAPGFPPAASHFRAGLLFNRTLTGPGQISHHGLMYEWLVVLATKSLVR